MPAVRAVALWKLMFSKTFFDNTEEIEMDLALWGAMVALHSHDAHSLLHCLGISIAEQEGPQPSEGQARHNRPIRAR